MCHLAPNLRKLNWINDSKLNNIYIYVCNYCIFFGTILCNFGILYIYIYMCEREREREREIIVFVSFFWVEYYVILEQVLQMTPQS